MSVFQFGPVIRRRREELGYTQEELVDGICAVTTLSRIENGERMPRREHFEMLVQRLGFSNTMLDTYVDEKEFRKYELKYQLRQAIFWKQMDKAQALLEECRQAIDIPTAIDKQFLILYQFLTHPAEYSRSQQLPMLEEALRLTCPSYDKNQFPILLAYEEILIINSIAIAYFYEGAQEKAVDLLYELKRYYEKHIVDPLEALKTQPMVLYNLSKFLGLMGRYDESIETSSFGIQICTETGRCSALPMLYYNHTWALVKRGRKEDMPAARQSARNAYHLAAAIGKEASCDLYRKFLSEHFPEELPG